MIHTVHLDDEYINVKELLQELYRQKEGVHFEYSAANGAPEGYMTGEDFWREADKRIVMICKKYGIL